MNSSLFTVTKGLLLRPLLFPRLEQLVDISLSGRVLCRAGISTAAGAAFGIGGAIALRKVVASQLVSVSATDLTVLTAVSIAIAAAALAAAWSPALRAARVDPADALRTE